MKRSLPLLSALPVALVLLALAVPAQAQPRYSDRYGPPPAASSLDGTWYNRANGGECQIIQREPDRAMLINENGSRARATVDGDRLYVPAWGNAVARIRGDRIIWPDGNYWYR